LDSIWILNLELSNKFREDIESYLISMNATITSLDAGNIAYKLCQNLGGFKSLGPFLQGFKKPVCDLSRGASTEDIISSSLLTLASI